MGLQKRRGTCLITILALALLAPAAAHGATLKPGDLLVANYQDAGDAKEGVIKVDPQSGKMSLVSSNLQAVNFGSSQLFTGPWDLLLMPKGELIVSDAGQQLIGVNPATGKQRLISSNAQPINSSSAYMSFPTGIVRLPNGDLAVGSDPPVGVVRIDPGTGKQSILSSNDQAINVGTAYYSSVYDLTSGLGGALVVADTSAFGDGGLISVDPVTGKQTRLSSNDQPINAGSQFFGGGVASVQLHRGSFYVSDRTADGGAGGVVGVDPATGKQRLISSDAQAVNAGSMYFVNNYGLAVEPGGRIIVTVETAFSDSNGGVLAVDPLTGKESILANDLNPPNFGSSELVSYPDGVMVVPPKCGGLYPTIVGSSGKDKLAGTRFPDIIAGLGGRDTLRGLGGGDRLCGGPGPDLLIGGKGKDRLFGAAGNDRLRGGPGRDQLRGGPGRDVQRP